MEKKTKGRGEEIELFILALYDLGAIRFGKFSLHSGLTSPIYIDLRQLVAVPRLIKVPFVRLCLFSYFSLLLLGCGWLDRYSVIIVLLSTGFLFFLIFVPI